jgi:hypothetical protein
MVPVLIPGMSSGHLLKGNTGPYNLFLIFLSRVSGNRRRQASLGENTNRIASVTRLGVAEVFVHP